MNKSGPLVREDIPLPHYPEPLLIPLDYIEISMRKAGYDVAMSEGSLFLMSKAVEEFARILMRRTMRDGIVDLNYDEMAEFVQNSEFEMLKPFFPLRMSLAEALRLRDAQNAQNAHNTR